MRIVKFKYGNSLFTVNENGRVCDSSGKELRPHRDQRVRGEDAHLRLTLFDGDKSYKVRLHRIMGICFLNTTNNDVLGYRDGDVTNNTVGNLYVTKQHKNVTDANNIIIPVNANPESTFSRHRGYQQGKKVAKPAAPTNLKDGRYVTVSNGFGTFPVLEMDFYNYKYFANHGFKIVA